VFREALALSSVGAEASSPSPYASPRKNLPPSPGTEATFALVWRPIISLLQIAVAGVEGFFFLGLYTTFIVKGPVFLLRRRGTFFLVGF